MKNWCDEVAVLCDGEALWWRGGGGGGGEEEPRWSVEGMRWGCGAVLEW